MNTYKKDILANIGYTELVYGRINKKLVRVLILSNIKSHILKLEFPTLNFHNFWI